VTKTYINSISLILFWEKISRQKLYIKVVKSAKEKEKEGISRHHVTCCSLRFYSSSSAFCSSSIQLDVSYIHASATTSMLYRCISVHPFLHSTRGENSEWVRFTSYAGTDVHTATHTKLTTTRATVGTHAFSIVRWLNSLISQIPAGTMPRGVRRRVQQPPRRQGGPLLSWFVHCCPIT